MHPSEIHEKHRQKCLKETHDRAHDGEVTERSEDQGAGIVKGLAHH